jgi:hypothetical protein
MIKRKYYPYWEWEEYYCGMWRDVNKTEKDEFISCAVEFMNNTTNFGNYMLQTVDQWPISSAQNLSNTGMNRRAWLGQAACCVAFNCPESAVRQAWNMLDAQKQTAANTEADIAIMYWEENYATEEEDEEISESKRSRGCA